MKQKLYIFICALISICAQHPAYAAEKTLIDGLYYYLYSSKEYSWVEENYACVAAPTVGGYAGNIIIPDTVQYEGISYPVTEIGGYAFCYDRGVTSISIPNTVKEIRVNAFLDCKGLEKLTIPKSVTKMGVDLFGGCDLHPLIIQGTGLDYTDVFKRMNTNTIVYAHSSEISKIQDAYTGEVRNLDEPYYISIKKEYINGVKFTLSPNPDYEKNASALTVKVDGVEITADEDGTYFAKDIIKDSDLKDGLVNISRKLYIIIQSTDDDGNVLTDSCKFNLSVPNIAVTCDTTQTSNTFTIVADSDETASPIKAYITDKEGKIFFDKKEDGTFSLTLSNYDPKTKYTVTPIVSYEKGEYSNGTVSFTTKSLFPQKLYG